MLHTSHCVFMSAKTERVMLLFDNHHEDSLHENHLFFDIVCSVCIFIFVSSLNNSFCLSLSFYISERMLVAIESC